MMASAGIKRPEPTEYQDYFEKYIALVPQGDIAETLNRQITETLTLLRGLSESQADSRYAPDKWSIKELVGHLIDSERIFAYRALRFARNDKTALPGFEQDDYVQYASFATRSIGDLANELEHVRLASLDLFRSLDEEAWQRRGLANDAEISVRALVYIIAGHELHHIQVLKTKYL